MRKGYIMTKKEISELFLVLSNAIPKMQGKIQTMAREYHKKIEEALELGVY